MTRSCSKSAMHCATFRHLPLEEQLKACSDAGFHNVWLYAESVEHHLATGADLDDIKGMLAALGLTAIGLGSLTHWASVPRESVQELTAAAERICSLARALDCHRISANSRGATEPFDFDRAAVNLRTICEVAGAHGSSVGLEFLPWTSIPDVRTAWRLIGATERDNVGLIIDTFHFFMGGSQFSDLDMVPTARVFMLHLNDLPAVGGDKDLATLSGHCRVLPGEGVLPVREFVAEFK